MSALSTSRDAYSDCSRIIALNNEGASSLASGEMALAISTFCQALHMAKACLVVRRQERIREEQGDDGNDYSHHRNYNQYENLEESNQTLSGSVESLSPTLSHFDIGHLMEADCFGLHSNEENDESCPEMENSNSTIKKSFSVPSTYSNVGRTEKVEKNKDLTNTTLSNGGFIYRKPIRVPISYAHHTGLQRSEVILPSIVIFNLALAHHMWAMKNESKLEEDVDVVSNWQNVQSSPLMLLKKSAKLYGLAIQLQEGQVVNEGPQAYSKLFFLSCINNLGDAHRLLGDIALAEKIYQQLLTMLMYLNYSEQQQGYELSTIDTSTLVPNASSTSAQSTSTSTFSAGRTYGSFFRNIFQSEVNSAPAA